MKEEVCIWEWWWERIRKV